MENLKYKPLGHRILIEVQMPEHVRKLLSSGLALPEGMEQKEALIADEGRVLAIGENAFKAFDDGKPWCKVGDVVRVARGSGIIVPAPEESVFYRFVNDEDLYAQICEDNYDGV